MDKPAGDDVSVRETAEPAVPRHRLSTRIWHWVNAVAVIVLLMSGLMILNAHPRLYWGEYGADFDRAWLELPYFPGWATIPSMYDLAGARRWHLAFAWVLGITFTLFVIISLISGHFRRDLTPTDEELEPSHLWRSVRDHARLRFTAAQAGHGYNVLQKLSYAALIFVLLPLLILSGLTMSPAMAAGWPWLLDLFGGRQSARSVHFLCAAAMALFILVHLSMVMLAGPVRETRSMITGRLSMPPERTS